VRLKKKEFSTVGRSLSLVGSFGLTMGAAILIGYYLGSYIDRKLGTAPWFMLVFLILFMIGAFIKFVQEAGGADKKTKTKGDISHT
jgi:F0F1-type ATP synthase assembly protein I